MLILSQRGRVGAGSPARGRMPALIWTKRGDEPSVLVGLPAPMRATTMAGHSEWSDVVHIRFPRASLTVPDRPTVRTAETGSVALDWDDMAGAESCPVRASGNGAGAILSEHDMVDGVGISFTNGFGVVVSVLPEGHDRCVFQVRAVNEHKASGWSGNNAVNTRLSRERVTGRPGASGS